MVCVLSNEFKFPTREITLRRLIGSVIVYVAIPGFTALYLFGNPLDSNTIIDSDVAAEALEGSPLAGSERISGSNRIQKVIDLPPSSADRFAVRVPINDSTSYEVTLVTPDQSPGDMSNVVHHIRTYEVPESTARFDTMDPVYIRGYSDPSATIEMSVSRDR